MIMKKILGNKKMDRKAIPLGGDLNRFPIAKWN